jgi:N-methylhydantoinase B
MGDTRVRLKAKITIAGDRIHFDFTGTAAQARGSRNMPLSATQSTVFYAVKAITDPALPPNSGYFRAIDLTVPPGSILNCQPPAAVGDRVATANILGDVLLSALSKAAPARVMSGCGPLHGLIFSGIDTRGNDYFVDYETYGGASGGLADQDGRDAVRVHVSGAANLPVESVEQEFALTVERYQLIADSGGPGTFRGGLGTRRDITMWGKEARLAGRGLRQVEGARPLFGGRKGRTGRFVLHPDASAEQKLPSSFSELAVEPGITVRVETPSGAGYGDPFVRDPERVLRDVIEGKVSPERARSDYGIVIANGAVDPVATDRLRASRREKAPDGR